METRKVEKNPYVLKMIPFFVLALGILVLAILAFIFIKPYGIWIGIGLGVLSILIDILGIILGLRSDSVKCPGCARTLKRKSRQEAEYACEVCGINWVYSVSSDSY